MPQFRKGSSSFGEFVDNNEFSDDTLACDDGHLVEAHKVILAGSGPQTTIHTSWFQLVGGFVFRPSWRKKGRVFGNLLNNLGFRRLGLNEKETQESKIRERCSPSPLSNNPTQDGSLLCPPPHLVISLSQACDGTKRNMINNFWEIRFSPGTNIVDFC